MPPPRRSGDSLRKEGRRPKSSSSPSPSRSRSSGTGLLSLPEAYDGTLKLFLALWLFRAANSLVVRTYFHPDEYWQSLEVAHVAVFGYGALCWETLEEIRGFSFPALFIPPYGLLKLLGLDGVRPIFIHFPIVTVCALTAAAGDFATYCLAKRACGNASATYALLFSVLSWFNFYTTVRPFSNPIESTLCVTALCLWPIWAGGFSKGDVVEVDRAQAAGAGGVATVVAVDAEFETYAVKYVAGGPREKDLPAEALTKVGTFEQPGSDDAFALALGLTPRQLALLLAAIAVIMRPTCLTMWLCLGLHQLFVLPMSEKPALVAEAVVIGLSVLALSAVIDCWWYGHWVLPQLNFMGFNMLAQGAQRYGKHPWHWYVTRAAPFLLGSFLLPFSAALLDVAKGASTRGCQRLLVLSAIVVGLYSTQAHKEYRFILPALPLVLIVIAHVVAQSKAWRGILWPLLLAQTLPAVYFSAFHMRGSQDVMDALHAELSSSLAASPDEVSVGFLTACHMTAWQAHLHMDIPVHFPDCSPSKAAGCRGLSDETCSIAQRRWPTKDEMASSKSTDDGTDEMTHMFADAVAYAEATYGEEVAARWGGIASPSHLVMFEPMAAAVAPFLEKGGYTACVTVDSGHVPWLKLARDCKPVASLRLALSR